MEMNHFTAVVAEDETLLLKDLVRKIEQSGLGFSVVGTAQTGKAAYALIQEKVPDVLVTDIKMPIMSGLELIEKVHNHYPFIHIIITSGFSDFEYAKSAIHFQVKEYLLKPIDISELYEVLKTIRIGLDEEQTVYSAAFSMIAAQSTPKEIADDLKNFILKHFSEDINLNLIANAINYSPSYLSRVFCQFYEMTPSQYLINLRIYQAKHDLAYRPELSIRQIGESVGYPDQGYFSRIFKKKTGMSPMRYRNISMKNAYEAD